MKKYLPVLFILLLMACSNNVKDLTKGAATKCNIHNVKMKKQKVSIVYGLIKPALPESVIIKYTVNANNYVTGGCIYEKGMPHYAITYYCPECRKNTVKLKKANYTKKLNDILKKYENGDKGYNEKEIELKLAKKILNG